MATTKSPKPFATFASALDAMDANDICTTIEVATDEIRNAESVENMTDYEASLACAEQALADALKIIKALRARAIATLAI